MIGIKRGRELSLMIVNRIIRTLLVFVSSACHRYANDKLLLGLICIVLDHVQVCRDTKSPVFKQRHPVHLPTALQLRPTAVYANTEPST